MERQEVDQCLGHWGGNPAIYVLVLCWAFPYRHIPSFSVPYPQMPSSIPTPGVTWSLQLLEYDACTVRVVHTFPNLLSFPSCRLPFGH